MINKKVYLAKNTLASGFDVEYVKSHLSRIPGIIIIEANSNFSPSDCSAFIIIPDDNATSSFTDKISLSKNVHHSLWEFIENYEEDQDVNECIYIFKGSEESEAPGDVEKAYPMAFFADEELRTTILEGNNYNAYSTISIGEEGDIPLLGIIAEIIGEDSTSWVEIPRHFTPPPIYAVPPVPSLEERKLKNYSVFDVNSVQKRIDEITKDRRRLLLLKRK